MSTDADGQVLWLVGAEFRHDGPAADEPELAVTYRPARHELGVVRKLGRFPGNGFPYFVHFIAYFPEPVRNPDDGELCLD